MELTRRNAQKPNQEGALAAAAARDSGRDEESPPPRDSGRVEESQKLYSLFYSPSSSSPHPSPAAAAKSPQSPGYRRGFLTRKVLSVFIIDDGSGNIKGRGVVGFFQGIIVGTVVLTLLLSFTLWLDFVLKPTHTVRAKAFAILSDPETLKNVEEASSLKFIPIEKYDAIDKEVRSLRDQLDGKSKEMEELDNQTKELIFLREHMHVLERKLGLDEYCGSCICWGTSTCDGCLNHLKLTRDMTTNQAKKMLVDDGDNQCTNARTQAAAVKTEVQAAEAQAAEAQAAAKVEAEAEAAANAEAAAANAEAEAAARAAAANAEAEAAAARTAAANAEAEAAARATAANVEAEEAAKAVA